MFTEVLSEVLGSAVSSHVDLEKLCSSTSGQRVDLPGKTCDDRETIEEPGTEWIFSCPTVNWLQAAAEKQQNMWAYQFRNVMPIGSAVLLTFLTLWFLIYR